MNPKTMNRSPKSRSKKEIPKPDWKIIHKPMTKSGLVTSFL